MKQWAVVPFALLSVAAQAPPSPRPKAPPVLPVVVIVIEGIVKGPDGKPVEKALVQAVRSPARATEAPYLARTEPTGRFRIELRSVGGAYNIRVEARGLAPHRLTDVRPGRPLDITLAKGATLEGTVRDSQTGRPVSKARVTVVDERGFGPAAFENDLGVNRVESDAKGQFRVEALGPGFHTVSAQAHGVGYGRVLNARAGSRVEVLLLPGASLSGRVVGPQGQPIEGAVVIVLGEARGTSTPGGPYRTDAQGRFEVHGLDPAAYWVQVQHKDYAPAILTGIEVDREVGAEVEAQLSQGSRVTGRLMDSSGKPLAGDVRLLEVDGHPALSVLALALRAQAGADGRFTLPRVAPGSYVFAATAPRVAPQRVEAEVPRRATGPVDLGDVTLEAGLTVRGHVRDQGGQPIAGAEIRGYVARSNEATFPSEAQAEADGSFVLGGLSPGSYRVTARAAGYAEAMREVETGAEGVKLLLAAGGSVTGVVVDEAGRAVEAFDVVAEAVRRSSRGPYLMPVRDRVTDPSGRFTLRDLAEGEYTVTAEAPERAPGTTPATSVKAGGTSDVGRIQLLRGGVVKGSVVDSGGTPMAGASIQVRSATGEGPFRIMSPRATTDSAGAFEVLGVAAGKAEVVANRQGYAPGHVSVDVDPARGPAEARVVLTLGGRVEGWARKRDGRPLQGQIHVTSAGPAGFLFRPLTAPVRSDGTFLVDQVPAGRMRVLLMEGTASRLRSTLGKEVDVREGETTTLELLSRDILVSGRVTRNGAGLASVRVNVRSRHSMGAMSSYSTGPSLGPPQGLQRGTAVTREDGSYELLMDEPGDAGASVETLDGRTTLIWRNTEIPDAESHALDFAIGGAKLSGVVVDKQTGRPVPEARLYAPRRGPRAEGLHSADIGPDGRFTLEVEPGTYALKVHSEDYLDHSQDVTVGEAGLTDLRIELGRGHTIEGRVVDASGRPVAGVNVGAAARSSGDFARTLADGAFRFNGLKNVPFNILAVSPTAGFAFQAGVAAGTKGLVLTLQPGGKARVQVVGPDGAPLEEARVGLQSLGGNLATGISSSTNAQGMTEMDLPVGAVELMAFKEKLRGNARVNVLPGATVTVQVELREGLRAGTPQQ